MVSNLETEQINIFLPSLTHSIQLILVIQRQHYEKVGKQKSTTPSSKGLVWRIPERLLIIVFSLSPSLVKLSLPKVEASAKWKIPRSSILTHKFHGAQREENVKKGPKKVHSLHLILSVILLSFLLKTAFNCVSFDLCVCVCVCVCVKCWKYGAPPSG